MAAAAILKILKIAINLGCGWTDFDKIWHTYAIRVDPLERPDR